MAKVSHRTRDEAIYDGSTGNQVDTRTVHELGVTVDGVFVPFMSKEGSYIDRLVADGKARQEADGGSDGDGDAEGDGGE